MSKHLRILIAILITLTSFIGAGQHGLAQEATPDTGAGTFQSELTGANINLGDSDEAQFLPEMYWFGDNGGYLQEDISVRLGDALIFISLTSGETSPASWTQESIDSLPYYWVSVDILGQYVDDDFTWLLVSGVEQYDIEVALYYEFSANMFGENHGSIAIYSDPADLVDYVAWIQQNLTVDGESLLFASTDLDGIGAMLDGTSNLEPRPVTLPTSTVEDWSHLGLVSETEWIDPVTGTRLAWDVETLIFPFFVSYAIRDLPNDQTRVIHLRTPSSDGDVISSVTESVEDRTPEEWAERWSSDAWLSERGFYTPALGSRHDSTTSSVIFGRESSNFETIITVREGFYLSNGTFVFVDIRAREPNIVHVYEDTLATLEIDGNLIEPSWTSAELEEIISSPESSTPPPGSDAQVDDSSTITRTSRGTSSFDENDPSHRTNVESGRERLVCFYLESHDSLNLRDTSHCD